MPQTPAIIPESDAARRLQKPSAKEKQEKNKLITSLLKKHNAIIHIEGSLTLLERRLYNVLLLNAYDNLENERTHSIPVWILCEMLSYNSKNVGHLQASLKTLQTTILEVNLLKDGRRIWEAMTLLSYAKIENGICTYRYDEAIAKRLHTPEVYTSINLAVQNEFSSSHALSLYENCVRFRDVGKTSAWELDLLRMMMGVHTEKSYKDFKIFNAACLKKTIQEINDRSDIQIEPVFEKTGRAITAVSFKVSKRKQRSLYAGDIDDPTTRVRQSSTYIRLRSLGMSDQMALMYASHGGGRVEAVLAHMDRELKRAPERIRNKIAWLRALVDSGVDLDAPAVEIEKAAAAVVEETTRQRQEAERENARHMLKNARTRVAFTQLTPEALQSMLNDYMKAVGRTIVAGADGYPADVTERNLFSMWARPRLVCDEPSSEEIEQVLLSNPVKAR